jgi:ornithine cyclodeaminase
MLRIDSTTVHRLLDFQTLVQALDEGHRRGVEAWDRSLLSQPGESGVENHLLVWPAWQRGEGLGVKIATIFPANTQTTTLPSVHAQYLLFDGQTGEPRALIDGIALTVWKTAADSALGARYLARADVQTLLMVGAGAQAAHQVRGHLSVRPSLERLLLWNRSPDRAAALAKELADTGQEVAVARELESAVREADLICCATGSREPLIHGDWLKPGAHLDLVGGFTPEMREADDEAVRRAAIYVDSRWFTLRDCGDIAAPIAAGVIDEDDVIADLFQLCRGERQGRHDPQQITLFKNAGGAHLDLMVALLIAKRVEREAAA